LDLWDGLVLKKDAGADGREYIKNAGKGAVFLFTTGGATGKKPWPRSRSFSRSRAKRLPVRAAEDLLRIDEDYNPVPVPPGASR